MQAPRPRRDLGAELARLSQEGLERHLLPVRGVDLTSNDYLALSRDRRVQDAVSQAAREHAVSGTGSRLLSGQHPLFAELEKRFAAWQGTAGALLHATGYAANTGLLGALIGPDDLVVSDALNHASLIDGIRLSRAQVVVTPHGDVDAVVAALRAHPRRHAWVVTESVFSMDGTHAPLEDLAAVCRTQGARLIVDEAHATGLYGPSGAGLVEQTGTRADVFASVHTGGKALGGQGALVCGDTELVRWLVHRSRSFVFSTAPPPHQAAGLLASMAILVDDPALRARPRALARRLRERLDDALPTLGDDTPIVPVVVGSNARALALQDWLQHRGWFVRAVRPPTVPEGSSRIRIVLHADHTDAVVDALADDLRSWARENP